MTWGWTDLTDERERRLDMERQGMERMSERLASFYHRHDFTIDALTALGAVVAFVGFGRWLLS